MAVMVEGWREVKLRIVGGAWLFGRVVEGVGGFMERKISEGRIVFDGEVIVGEGASSREGEIDGGVFVVYGCA